MKFCRRLLPLVIVSTLVLGICPTAMAANDTPERILLSSEETTLEKIYDLSSEDLKSDIDGSAEGFYWDADQCTLTIDENFKYSIFADGDLELLVDGDVFLGNTVTVNKGIISVTDTLSIRSATDEPVSLSITLNESGASSAIFAGDYQGTDSQGKLAIHSNVTVNVTLTSSAGSKADNENLGKSSISAVKTGDGGVYLYGVLNVAAKGYVNIAGITADKVRLLGESELNVDVDLLGSAENNAVSDKIAYGISGDMEAGYDTKATVDVNNTYGCTGDLGDVIVGAYGANNVAAGNNAQIAFDVSSALGDEKALDTLSISGSAAVTANGKAYENSMYRFDVELDEYLDIELADAQKAGYVYSGEDVKAVLKLKDGVDPEKYAIPETVEVLVWGEPLPYPVYDYDNTTGEFTFDGNYILGNLTIKGAAVEKNVFSDGGDDSEIDDGNKPSAGDDTQSDNSDAKSPSTGDGTNVMWIALLAAAVAIFGGRKYAVRK